ncbi:MAG: hypothetical protein WBM65_09020, partial [Sedimenticolaceae bacterium]
DGNAHRDWGVSCSWEKKVDRFDNKHHKEHRLLLKHLDYICNAISKGERPAFYSQYDVSNDWFLAHIMGFDKTLGAFLNSKGVY